VQRRARGQRTLGERGVETATIDDGRDDLLGVDDDRGSSARAKGSSTGQTEDGVARQIQLCERLVAEHARAVHRTTDDIVLFEDDNVMARAGEARRRGKAGGSGAYNDYVMHL